VYGQEEGVKQQAKEVLVDKVEALKVIENQEFIAMRAAEKI
jgi:hypothetical protein